MLKLFKKLYFFFQTRSDAPWASFEVGEIGENGQMKVDFNWNKSFITTLNELGFKSETEEDTVQLFFFASQMRPESLIQDESPVASDSHPQLSNKQNFFKK